MNLKTLLAGIGGITGIGAVILFVQTDLFTSPITTSISVITVGFVVLAALAQTADRELEIVGVILCAVSLVSGVIYSVVQLTDGSLTITIALGLFSILFLFAAYMTQTEKQLITRRNTKLVAGVLVVLAVCVAGADMFMGSPTYSFDLNETVTEEQIEDQSPYRPSGSQYVLGDLTIRNQSFLPQETETPHYRGCITGVEFNENTEQGERMTRIQQDVPIYTTQIDQYITGTQTAKIVINRGIVEDIEHLTAREITDYRVQQATTCPDSSEEPTITVIYGGNPQ